MDSTALIRTVVCDDEPDAREGIATMLRADPSVVVVSEAKNGLEAVDAINSQGPDLVFLDVQMPRLDGFGVIERIGVERFPVVVFVTAFDEYALRAFEVHALDYLLKPFGDDRFSDALARAKSRVRQRRACELSQGLASLLARGDKSAISAPAVETPVPAARDPMAPGRTYLDHIMVRLAGTVTLIRVEDVDWIEGDDYYAKLHVGGKTHLLRETMQQLETKLDPSQFVRVHRSAIVRIDRVQTLHPYFKGSHMLTLKDGTRVTLSRSRRAAFEAALGGHV
jgi:two-component system LytT family response regulator